MNAQIQSRRLHDVDELLEKALGTLGQKAPEATSQTGTITGNDILRVIAGRQSLISVVDAE